MTEFVKKTKLTELENKIPDVSSSAKKTALTAVENKKPSVSSLVKKQTMTQKLVSLKKNYWSWSWQVCYYSRVYTLVASVFNARLAQANFITKIDFDAKLSSVTEKLLQIKQNIYSLKMSWKS